MNAKNWTLRLLTALVVCIGSVSISHAGSIGVNFVGGGNGVTNGASLASGDTAGVIPQTNWNNVTGNTGTGIALNNNAGAATAATLAFSASGTYTVGQASPVGGDQELNDGFIYGNGSVTVTNVPYSRYSVYVYELNDAAGRVETTTLTSPSGATYYGAAASPQDTNHVSGTANTYAYTQSTSTDPANPTPSGDYVLFANLTGSSFTFADSAPGNGYLNGFEIVNTAVPEPSSIIALAGLGVMSLVSFTVRRRRRTAHAGR